MYDRERAQSRQHEIARGRDSACYSHPSGARREAELGDEVPCGGSKIADDDVRAEPPHGAHPRDDLGERVVWADKEGFHPAPKAEVGSALHDGVRDLQVGQRVGRGESKVERGCGAVIVMVLDYFVIPAVRGDEKDAQGDSAGQYATLRLAEGQSRILDRAGVSRRLPSTYEFR